MAEYKTCYCCGTTSPVEEFSTPVGEDAKYIHQIVFNNYDNKEIPLCPRCMRLVLISLYTAASVKNIDDSLFPLPYVMEEPDEN